MTDVDTYDPLAGIVTGDWLDAQEFPPLAWLVPEILPAGYSVIAGPPKVGKSWATLDLALAVAQGSRAFGKVWTGQARPVLLLALEDGHRRIQSRARTLLGSSAAIPANLHLLCDLTPGNFLVTVRAWLERYAQDGGEALVVVDTLGKIAPPPLPGEGAYQRDYRIGSELKRVCADHPGVALLVVHHDRKAGATDFVETVSGTNGLTGAADAVLVLSRDRQSDEGLLRITGRDVIENEYALRIVDGVAWTLAADDLWQAAEVAVELRATSGVGDDMSKVIALVTRTPGGVRASDVVTKLGLEEATARQYLNRAAKGERITKAGRGLYTAVTSVTGVTSGLPDRSLYVPSEENDVTRDSCDDVTGGAVA